MLVSVYEKRGLNGLIPALVRINPGLLIYSTGGTFEAIRTILGDRAEKNLTRISDYTGQPEMQGGLVKTLDFKIYLGLLSETYNQAHAGDLARVQGITFDMVVVNLYPFLKIIREPGVRPEKARANIDIGGPCMIRAAAKNFLRVASVVDPDDYDRIIKELKESGGCTGLRTRCELAKKTFAYTARYDAAIADYLSGLSFDEVDECYNRKNNHGA